MTLYIIPCACTCVFERTYAAYRTGGKGSGTLPKDGGEGTHSSVMPPKEAGHGGVSGYSAGRDLCSGSHGASSRPCLPLTNEETEAELTAGLRPLSRRGYSLQRGVRAPGACV